MNIYNENKSENNKIQLNSVQKTRPDADIEFFWMTFKNSIKLYVTDNDVLELNMLSNKLNKLQSEEQYIQIQKLISKHLDKICWIFIKNRNSYDGNFILDNLKKWKALCSTKNWKNNLHYSDPIPYNSVSYAILRIMNHYKKKYDNVYYSSRRASSKKKLNSYNKILKLTEEIAEAFIREESNDFTKEIKDKLINTSIHNLINHSIENKLESPIHHLIPIINFDLYLAQTVSKNIRKMIQLKNSKSRKLLKYLQIQKEVPNLI